MRLRHPQVLNPTRGRSPRQTILFYEEAPSPKMPAPLPMDYFFKETHLYSVRRVPACPRATGPREPVNIHHNHQHYNRYREFGPVLRGLHSGVGE